MLSKMPHVSRTNFGEYIISFFLIKLNTCLQDGLSLFDQLDEEKLSTFVHEYLHFLQDVTTVSGLARFVSMSKLIQTCIYEIYQSKGPVELPYSLDKSSVKNADAESDIQEFYLGCDRHLKIHHIDSIQVERESLLDTWIPFSEGIHAVNLYFDEKSEPYVFGSTCIRESISYLIEHLKFGAKVRIKELPYNSCELVCEHLYPELARRKDVIVLLAEYSLMHYHSGRMFFELLQKMKQSKAVNLSLAEIEKICLEETSHLNMDFDKACQEIEGAVDFLYPLNTPFSQANSYLKHLIRGGINYKKRYNLPMSLFLTLDQNNANYYLRTLVREIGLPLIVNNQHETFSTEEDLSYFLVPIALYQLFFCLKSPECYLYPYCETAKHPCLDKLLCHDLPWKQVEKDKLCPFAALWHHYSLSDKEVQCRGR